MVRYGWRVKLEEAVNFVLPFQNPQNSKSLNWNRAHSCLLPSLA